MKISVRKSDPGYLPNLVGVVVTVNGHAIRDCFRADEEIGEAWCLARARDGELILNSDYRSVLEICYKGDVVIHLPKRHQLNESSAKERLIKDGNEAGGETLSTSVERNTSVLMETKFLKSGEVMKLLRQTDRAAFWASVKAAGIPYIRINARRCLFEEEAVLAWLKSRTAGRSNL